MLRLENKDFFHNVKSHTFETPAIPLRSWDCETSDTWID